MTNVVNNHCYIEDDSRGIVLSNVSYEVGMVLNGYLKGLYQAVSGYDEIIDLDTSKIQTTQGNQVIPKNISEYASLKQESNTLKYIQINNILFSNPLYDQNESYILFKDEKIRIKDYEHVLTNQTMPYEGDVVGYVSSDSNEVEFWLVKYDQIVWRKLFEPTYTTSISSTPGNRLITIHTPYPWPIYYTTDDMQPSVSSYVYEQPIEVPVSTNIKSYTQNSDGLQSDVAPIKVKDYEYMLIGVWDEDSFISMTCNDKVSKLDCDTILFDQNGGIPVLDRTSIWKMVRLNQNGGIKLISLKNDSVILKTEGEPDISMSSDHASIFKLVKNEDNQTYHILLTEDKNERKLAFRKSGYWGLFTLTPENSFLLDLTLIPLDTTIGNNDKMLFGPYSEVALAKIIKSPELTSLDVREADLFLSNYVVAPQNPNCLFITSKNEIYFSNQIVNNVCENLNLEDKCPLHISPAIQAQKGSYSRETYQDGGWESIILPFDVDELPEQYDFEEYQSHTEKSVKFVTVDSLKANVPYLMRYTGSDASMNKKGSFTFSFNKNTLVETNVMESPYMGSFETKSGVGKYLLNSDGTAFCKGSENSKITPFHCYFDPPSSLKLKEVQINHFNENATQSNIVSTTKKELNIQFNGVSLIIHSECVRDLSIFDCWGRLIRKIHVLPGETILENHLKKGLYFIEKQKIMVY